MHHPKRWDSLDVFRGVTIAAMILVNNPGDWSQTYPLLLHADWHGCTPTDWVFPFFLFILGVAIPFSLGMREPGSTAQPLPWRRLLRRSASLFGLGLFLALFPEFRFREDQANSLRLLHFALLAAAMISGFIRMADTALNRESQPIWRYLTFGSIVGMVLLGIFCYDFSYLRIPGVLQRIALVYLLASLVYLSLPLRSQLVLGALILLGYWALLTLVPVPGGLAPNLEPETNLGAWLDRALFTENHLWRTAKTWDPEGLLSTLPAVVTGLIGVWTGMWIRGEAAWRDKLRKLAGCGAVLVALGLLWDQVFPINKKIWTSSYVLYVGGLAQIFLAVLYVLVEGKGGLGSASPKAWTAPFRIFGTNAIFAFALSGIFTKLLLAIRWEGASTEAVITLRGWLYDTCFVPWFSPLNASLAFGLFNVALILFFTWLLYRQKVFLKV